MIAAGFYALAAILLIASMLTSKTTGRRIKNLAFIIAMEICYSLVVFITPCMVSAFCIEIHKGVIFHAKPMWSKGFLVGGTVMLLVTHFLNLSTIEDNPDVGTFFRKHSKLGVYAPIMFNLRLITISALLYVYHITPTIPSYAIIIAQFGYLTFILFGRPHKKPFDLVRSVCLEIGLLYIFL